MPLTKMSLGICLAIIAASLLQTDALGQDNNRQKAIQLEVDASQITRKLVRSRLEIPVKPGPLTLAYPKWIPGKHSPAGPIADLVGLKITAGRAIVPWQRDEVDGYALHCEVPKGADTLQVSLEYVAAGSGIGNPKITPKLAVIEWDQVLLYPRGQNASNIIFQASLKLPKDWKIGGALQVDPNFKKQGWLRFQPVSLETLIDSPMLSGINFRRVRLAPHTNPEHYLVLAADSPEAIEIPDDLKKQYDRLVEETLQLFGCHHYKQYHFLLALSDHIPFGGLEHHESSDNRLPEKSLIDPSMHKLAASLLPHEMVHSWNGKYRRPASMIVKDFQEPHRTKLLWVYEGLTSYLDDVLTARAGFRSLEETRDFLALTAEGMNNQRGRTWRPLEDTSAGAHVLYMATGGWNSWRRGLDYYDEGMLIWLDVDTLIRQRTKGKKSLDDFCRLFFGGKSGHPAVKGYTFDDLVQTLNEVTPHDWKALLIRRVSLPNEQAPLDGIIRAGWKLSHGETPTKMFSGREKVRKSIDLSSSIGLVLKSDGTVADVIRGKAADKAGLGPGMKLVAINSRRWSPELLKSAIRASKKGNPIQLLVENSEFFQNYPLDYRDGLRYPILERTSLAQPDLLEEIYHPRVSSKD